MSATATKSRVNSALSLAEVQQLLFRGSDLLDPRQVKSCPIVVPSKLPALMVTEEEVRRAKTLGHSLVLFLPVTAKQLYGATDNKLSDGGQLLYSDWSIKPKQDFGVKEMQFAKPTWAFIIQAPIPSSTGLNFLAQTKMRAEYLENQVYDGQPLPQVYREAVEELNDRQAALEQLMADDWQEAGKQLSGLKLNQLCCPTFSGLLYHWYLHLAINGERLYQGIYGWSRSLSSNGHLVDPGSFGRLGAFAGGDWEPGSSYGSLGAPFLRRIGEE